MKIAVVKEMAPLEKRVAATPDTVKKYLELGFEVGIEKDAGINSYYSNESYKKAGAIIYSDVKNLISNADIILKVNNIYVKNITDIFKIIEEGLYQVGDFIVLDILRNNQKIKIKLQLDSSK